MLLLLPLLLGSLVSDAQNAVPAISSAPAPKQPGEPLAENLTPLELLETLQHEPQKLPTTPPIHSVDTQPNSLSPLNVDYPTNSLLSSLAQHDSRLLSESPTKRSLSDYPEYDKSKILLVPQPGYPLQRVQVTAVTPSGTVTYNGKGQRVGSSSVYTGPYTPSMGGYYQGVYYRPQPSTTEKPPQSTATSPTAGGSTSGNPGWYKPQSSGTNQPSGGYQQPQQQQSYNQHQNPSYGQQQSNYNQQQQAQQQQQPSYGQQQPQQQQQQQPQQQQQQQSQQQQPQQPQQQQPSSSTSQQKPPSQGVNQPKPPPPLTSGGYYQGYYTPPTSDNQGGYFTGYFWPAGSNQGIYYNGYVPPLRPSESKPQAAGEGTSGAVTPPPPTQPSSSEVAPVETTPAPTSPPTPVQEPSSTTSPPPPGQTEKPWWLSGGGFGASSNNNAEMMVTEVTTPQAQLASTMATPPAAEPLSGSPEWSGGHGTGPATVLGTPHKGVETGLVNTQPSFGRWEVALNSPASPPLANPKPTSGLTVFGESVSNQNITLVFEDEANPVALTA